MAIMRMVALGQLAEELMKLDPCYRLPVYVKAASGLLPLQIFGLTSGKLLTRDTHTQTSHL